MKKAIAVAGLFYGDEGKGTMVDYLVRKNNASLVVRYNGGSQAAHNVITDDGKHHTFHQLGSGSFAGADTYISQYMLVDPLSLVMEEEAFRKVHESLDYHPEVIVSPGAVVITPYHKYLNQYREMSRGGDNHSSVGNGVGEARAMQLEGKALLWRDLLQADSLEGKLTQLLADVREKIFKIGPAVVDPGEGHPVERMMEFPPYLLARAYRNIALELNQATFPEIAAKHETVVFEGAQGVMLDEEFGFAPYNTWTACNFKNFYSLLDEDSYHGEVERVAVMRSYLTRHGKGPLLTENPDLKPVELHNVAHRFMGAMRYGYFDMALAREALQYLGDVDSLAVTHLDQCVSDLVNTGHSFIPEQIEALGRTEAYQSLKPLLKLWSQNPIDVVQSIQRETRLPVVYRSYGPAAKDKESSKGVAV